MDTYIPARENMSIYQDAVKLATSGKWHKHPNRKRKDFWKTEDFKSTKYNYITYHIIMTLVGYLYFQVYKNLEEGKAYVGKSLPVVAKNYKETRHF